MKMMKFEKNKAQENVTKHLLGNYTVCSHLQRVVWANLHSFNVINKQQGKVYFPISCVQMYININIQVHPYRYVLLLPTHQVNIYIALLLCIEHFFAKVKILHFININIYVAKGEKNRETILSSLLACFVITH